MRAYLDAAVLKGVVAKDDDAAAGAHKACRVGEHLLQRAQLVVHRDAQGLSFARVVIHGGEGGGVRKKVG